MGTRAQNVFAEVLAEQNELLGGGGAVVEHLLGRNQACEVSCHWFPLTTMQEQRPSMSVERMRRGHDSTAAPPSSCPTARKRPCLARASWPATSRRSVDNSSL